MTILLSQLSKYVDEERKKTLFKNEPHADMPCLSAIVVLITPKQSRKIKDPKCTSSVTYNHH